MKIIYNEYAERESKIKGHIGICLFGAYYEEILKSATDEEKIKMENKIQHKFMKNIDALNSVDDNLLNNLKLLNDYWESKETLFLTINRRLDNDVNKTQITRNPEFVININNVIDDYCNDCYFYLYKDEELPYLNEKDMMKDDIYIFELYTRSLELLNDDYLNKEKGTEEYDNMMFDAILNENYHISEIERLMGVYDEHISGNKQIKEDLQKYNDMLDNAENELERAKNKIKQWDNKYPNSNLSSDFLLRRDAAAILNNPRLDKIIENQLKSVELEPTQPKLEQEQPPFLDGFIIYVKTEEPSVMAFILEEYRNKDVEIKESSNFDKGAQVQKYNELLEKFVCKNYEVYKSYINESEKLKQIAIKNNLVDIDEYSEEEIIEATRKMIEEPNEFTSAYEQKSVGKRIKTFFKNHAKKIATVTVGALAAFSLINCDNSFSNSSDNEITNDDLSNMKGSIQKASDEIPDRVDDRSVNIGDVITLQEGQVYDHNSQADDGINGVVATDSVREPGKYTIDTLALIDTETNDILSVTTKTNLNALLDDAGVTLDDVLSGKVQIRANVNEGYSLDRNAAAGWIDINPEKYNAISNVADLEQAKGGRTR